MVASANRLSTPARLIIGFLVIAVALLVFFEFRPSGGQDVNNSLASRISIRQDSGNVQWKLPGGDWQAITAVSTLTGQAGKNGKDGTDGQAGENGKDGQDGKNGSIGVDGANGKDGTNGADGKDGVNGSDGAQGATGTTGAQGEQGMAGQAGQDGQDGTDGIAGINGADGADGTDGREIELQKDLLYIQWRYVGDPTWTNLIAYSDLKGDKGDKGDIGATGPANTLSIGSVTKPSDCTPAASITGTAPNQVLNLGIPGLPNGGTTGQVLQKKTNANCDVEWGDVSGGGEASLQLLPNIKHSLSAYTNAAFGPSVRLMSYYNVHKIEYSKIGTIIKVSAPGETGTVVIYYVDQNSLKLVDSFAVDFNNPGETQISKDSKSTLPRGLLFIGFIQSSSNPVGRIVRGSIDGTFSPVRDINGSGSIDIGLVAGPSYAPVQEIPYSGLSLNSGKVWGASDMPMVWVEG